MFQEVIEIQGEGAEQVERMEERKEEKAQTPIVNDYSDVAELTDINEWFVGEGEPETIPLFCGLKGEEEIS